MLNFKYFNFNIKLFYTFVFYKSHVEMKILLLLILSTSLTFSQTIENKNIDSKILNHKKEIQIDNEI